MKTRKITRSKVLSLILSVAMLISILPQMGIPVWAIEETGYIEGEDLEMTGPDISTETQVGEEDDSEITDDTIGTETQVIIGGNYGEGIILNSTTPYWTNDSNEATNNEEGYNAYFNSETGTLTLNNAVIEDYYMAPTNRFAVGIYSTGSLNIILKGSNTVDLSTISFPGHNSSYDSNGILAFTSLTIDSEPGGSLTSKGGNVRDTSAVFKNGMSSGIRSDTIIINSGEITAVGGAANLKSNGLYTGYGAHLEINGGKVTAIGGEVDYIPGLVNGSYGESSTNGKSSIQFDGGEFIAIGHNWGILNTFYDSGLEIFVSKNYDGSNLEKYDDYAKDHHKNKYSLLQPYKYFKVTHGSIANPNAIAKVKSLILGETYEVQQAVANNEYLAKYKIESLISHLALDGVSTEVIKKSYTPAIAGTKENPNGTDGSYTCTVKLSKGNSKGETDEFAMRIIATVYSIDEVREVIDLINILPGVIDRGHEKEVKEALIEYDKLPEGKKPLVTNFKKLAEAELALIRLAIDGGTVYVKSNATQEEKTKAVKQYVDEFLKLNCPGVTGEVYYYYNGPYKVSLSKGSYSKGPEIIEMTIIEGEESTLTRVTEVTITGTPEVGKTLTALVEPVDATVNYEWHSGGKPVGTNSKEYKVLESDLGKLITVKVTGTGKFTGSSASEGTKIIPVIKKTYEIEGTIKDEHSVLVEGATVKLRAGSRIVAEATTDTDGNFTLTGVPAGTYNLVISKGGQTVTQVITVSTGNVTVGTITLPKGNINSIVDVKPNTPDIVVGELNRFFQSTQFTQEDKNVVDSGGTVEIKLVVEKKDEAGDNAAANVDSIKAEAGSSKKEIGIFLDLTLNKLVKPENSPAEKPIMLSELENLLSINIPLPTELQGKNNYVIYRYHGTEVQTINETKNSDGEYIVVSLDKKSIILYTKKFSTYAIAYDLATTPDNGGGSGNNGGSEGNSGGSSGGNGGGSISNNGGNSNGSLPTIITETQGGGKITISKDRKEATITPDEGYIIADVIVDGKSIGVVTKYTFTNGDTHKIQAIFIKKTALPYYMKGGTKVYIGFSVLATDHYNYIAPAGEIIEFRDNPKNFIDNTIPWAKPSIDFVTERELFVGTSENIFSPNEAMTRAMFVTVIGRLYERSYGHISGKNTFLDVDQEAYYAKYVGWAHENGIIKGIGENKFSPKTMVTREQMGVIMRNFTAFLNKADVPDRALAYADSEDISSWAIEGAKYCQETKVITGRDSNNFAPKANATRAEVAAVIERFIRVIMK